MLELREKTKVSRLSGQQNGSQLEVDSTEHSKKSLINLQEFLTEKQTGSCKDPSAKYSQKEPAKSKNERVHKLFKQRPM